MKKSIRIYNLIFPMWSIYAFGVLFPTFLLILLPANFIVDTAALLFLFWRLRFPEKKGLYWKSIWKVWGFGFLADFLSSLVFFCISEMVDFGVYEINVYLPYSSVPSFLFTTAAIVFAGVLIYFFHCRWIWKRAEIGAAEQKRLALGMAVLTAPYLMYLPAA